MVNKGDATGKTTWDTGWGWELGLFVSVGTFELTCCDDKCKKHLARYKKKCYGLYSVGSVGGGVVTGLDGASCPRGYEGWFSEGSPIPTPGAGCVILLLSVVKFNIGNYTATS